MAEPANQRYRVLKALVEALEPLDYVYALWEGGAVAFGRLDQWSDIDVCVDAADDRVADAFPVAEEALQSLAGIDLKYDVPEGSTHGYVQAFYRLKGTPKTMLIDLAIFRHSEPNKLLEPEIHGDVRFHFNKHGVVRIPPLDRDAFLKRMRRHKERLLLRFDAFACFVDKEINRANWIEAMDVYYRVILASLMQSLRMRHHAVHYDFGTRYIHYELPGKVVERLVALHFVRDESDLAGKVEEARRWFCDTVAGIDSDSLSPGS
jgi:predicted nucleotidyltransferase